jgi:hypothetical protein
MFAISKNLSLISEALGMGFSTVQAGRVLKDKCAGSPGEMTMMEATRQMLNRLRIRDPPSTHNKSESDDRGGHSEKALAKDQTSTPDENTGINATRAIRHKFTTFEGE